MSRPATADHGCCRSAFRCNRGLFATPGVRLDLQPHRAREADRAPQVVALAGATEHSWLRVAADWYVAQTAPSPLRSATLLAVPAPAVNYPPHALRRRTPLLHDYRDFRWKRVELRHDPRQRRTCEKSWRTDCGYLAASSSRRSRGQRPAGETVFDFNGPVDVGPRTRVTRSAIHRRCLLPHDCQSCEAGADCAVTQRFRAVVIA